eukprot:3100606-Rhodomonas_salina.1
MSGIPRTRFAGTRKIISEPVSWARALPFVGARGTRIVGDNLINVSPGRTPANLQPGIPGYPGTRGSPNQRYP